LPIVDLGRERSPVQRLASGLIDLTLSNDGLVRSAKVLTPNGNVLQRPLNKLYPLEIRAVDKDATEAPKECTPRELGQLRTVLPRASKARAYEVINEFEDSLQEPNSSQFTLRVEPIQESLNNQTSRSRQQKSTFPSLTSGNLKMGLTILAILALAVPSYANYPSCHNGIVEIAGKTHPYELCFNEDCRKFVGDGIAMTYELPISPLHNATNVTINYINNEGPMRLFVKVQQPANMALQGMRLISSVTRMEFAATNSARSFYSIEYKRALYRDPLTNKTVGFLKNWVPSVQVELETTLFGKTQKGSLFLEPYLTSKFYTFNVTAMSVQKPTLSLLGKRFAISQNRSMILPDQFVVPVECATLEETTMNFQNCVNKIICDCNTADVESIVTVQSRFLMETVNFVDDEKCKVELSSLTGCYNCIQGAQITALCETKNPTEVAVHCAHNTFVIECGPTNPQNVVKLSYDHAVVNQHCFSVCGNENVTLPLNGTLLYHAERHQSVFDFNQELKHKQNFMASIADIKIPDLSPLLNTIRAHWKLAMVAATSVMVSRLILTFGPLF
ncbi:hypothetical protein OSTOST_24571, partial [Ostertagia ostertagi]